MKQLMNFTVREAIRIGANYANLRLRPERGPMPAIEPGQFVQVEVPRQKSAFLRRPLSVNYADSRELWLLIRRAGASTNTLCDLNEGDQLNILLPLGHGFSTNVSGRVLLIGGGVGVAPLLMLGQRLTVKGVDVKFLLGARSAADILQLDLFRQTAETFTTTDDGTLGHHGPVTSHPILQSHIDHIACCGPLPMMKAIASIARQHGINCEVSLENTMACGLGACLCCVEDTADNGNVCVCTEGPVFNINRLKW